MESKQLIKQLSIENSSTPSVKKKTAPPPSSPYITRGGVPVAPVFLKSNILKSPRLRNLQANIQAATQSVSLFTVLAG